MCPLFFGLYCVCCVWSVHCYCAFGMSTYFPSDMATSGNEFARELATLSKRECIAPYEKTGMRHTFII